MTCWSLVIRCSITEFRLWVAGPQCRLNSRKKIAAIEGLAEHAKQIPFSLQSARFLLRIMMCGEQDDRQAGMKPVQIGAEFQAVHSGHAEVRHQAADRIQRPVLDKPLCRRKGTRHMAGRVRRSATDSSTAWSSSTKATSDRVRTVIPVAVMRTRPVYRNVAFKHCAIRFRVGHTLAAKPSSEMRWDGDAQFTPGGRHGWRMKAIDDPVGLPSGCQSVVSDLGADDPVRGTQVEHFLESIQKLGVCTAAE